MISIEVEGLEEAREMLAYLHALGNEIQSAEVLGRKRHDDKPKRGRWSSYQDNNAGVLELMAMEPGNRDFFTMSDSEKTSVVDKPFIDKLWQGIQNIAKRQTETSIKIVAAAMKRDMGSAIAVQTHLASQAMGNALKAAALSYLRWISDNIKNQNWTGGGGDLSQEYAKYKQNKYGFKRPIGVASGQVLDNVAPDPTKNIRINRGR